MLRKKRQLANYEERHARGEWIASTRVEALFGRNGTPGSKAADNGMTLPFQSDANIAA